MRVTRSRLALLMTVCLLTSVFIAVPVAMAADARVYIHAVSPAKSGYAVDEAVTVNAKIKWEDLTANKTVELVLWNATYKFESLENYTIPVTSNSTGSVVLVSADGVYQPSYTPTTELTEKIGTKTFYLKLIGTDGLTLDSESFVVLVAEDQVTLSSVWQDTNNDRVVDQNEQVTFTIYVNWAFIENTESHSLYVDWGGGTDVLLTTVSVTAGSGSQTATANKGFDTTGAKSITFKLKDSTGTVIQSSTCSITVGAAAATTTTTTTEPAGIVALITSNWQIALIAVCVIVVAVVLYQKRGDEATPKKRKK